MSLFQGPAQGRWWRFDIGKCRLTRLALTVNAPAGTVFEVSYAQELIDGLVSPWMTLCGSTSCYLDRWTIGADVGGTEITLCPLEPRGCRYGPLNYRTAARTLFLRPYLAHFCSSFRHLFAICSVLTPGIRRVAPEDRGRLRNGRKRPRKEWSPPTSS
mgnify:CR=1 FL=1